MKKRSLFIAIFTAAFVLLSINDRPAQAYVEIPYTLGRVINEATNIVVVRVEKVDKERNLIIFSKVADLKGKHPTDTIKHNIGRGGFHPREWQFIMAAAEPGKIGLFFHNNSASETCLDNYWYQAYPGGEWWNMSHGEPYLLRSYAGKPEKLVQLVTDMLAGKDVIVPCMVDGDKNALQLRTAKIQRLKASLKIMDYDQKRDFAGWGGDEYRQLAGMSGFMMYGGLTRVDPGAIGMVSADIDGDGAADLCLYGENKVVVLKSAGKSMEEVSIPYSGGARGAAFGDYNHDGKVDLLLATTSGPRLLTNTGGAFKDDTAALPKEPYYNLTACAFADFDGDGKEDILLANGFLGLRLYRNNSGPQAVAAGPKLGKWYVMGPFDNAGGSGFEKAYPPEQGVDLKGEYPGRSGEKAVWKEANFTDGQPNSLALFRPEHNNWSVAYVYREIDVPAAMEMPISLGSDDTLSVWLNGEKLLAQNVLRPCTPDSEQLTLKLKPGKNKLLMKICQGDGEWAFYFAAKLPEKAPAVASQTFEDISERVGLGISGIGGKVKGDRLLIADVNGDGRPDFFYAAGNGLLAINATTGFTESKDSGLSFPCGKVTPVFGDINGDKAFDLLVPLPTGCKLFKNDGKGHFTDVTAQSGELGKVLNANCATFADFNATGKMDLLIGCTKGPNRYLKNDGKGVFSDGGEEIGLYQKVFNTRAIAAVDLNKDGVLDLALTNEGQESSVLIGSPARKK